MRALPPSALTFAEACELDTLIGQAFAEVAADAAERAGGVDLICSHGQTVYHWVRGRQVHGTLQIGQPAWIAERTGVPVVADVRVRDVVAGGQGAPLVSLMDVMLLSGLPGRPAGLNLGGIANMTVLRPVGGGGPVAYDTGPANALIDAAVVRASRGRLRYDEDGRLAAGGRVDEVLLTELLAEPYYRLDPPEEHRQGTVPRRLPGASADGAPRPVGRGHRRDADGADRADRRRPGSPPPGRHPRRLRRGLRQSDADGDAA